MLYTVPSARVTSPVVAVTPMVPASVVLRSPSAVCTTPAPPVRLRLPVVLETGALTVSRPAAFSVTLPEPWALTTLFTSSAPRVVRRSMLPLPARVRTPVPPMTRPLLSSTTMLPLAALVATRVPTVVLMSAAPPAEPMPVAAARAAVLPVMFAVSAAVPSLIAPAVAVTLTALLVVVIWPSTTLPAARTST